MRKPPLKWLQFYLGAGLLAFLVTITVGLDLLAHSQRLSNVLMRLDQQVNRKDRQRYSYQHYFPDFEDRLINEELPAADYSRGGTYLIGTSNLKWATRLWELPESEQRLIHTYGIGATDHYQQFQFIRHLVEHEKLIEAGGEKNLIILGASYHAIGDGINDVNPYFSSLWQRHGLYSYRMDTGITPLAVGRLSRFLRIERVRIAGLVGSTIYTVARQFGYHARLRRHDSEAYKRGRAEWLGPNWKEQLRFQVSQFKLMVEYLHARKVQIHVVFLPIGSWDDELPFEKEYIAQMTEACIEKSVPTLDWSKLLDDEDFADSNHPNLFGVDKLQPRFLDIAIPFLRSTGAL